MKYTLKDAERFELPGGTKGYIFPAHPLGEGSVVLVEAQGIYPAQGESINDRCTETLYVLEGKLIVTINDVRYGLRAGEVVMIMPGQRYRIRGSGKAIDFITPAWDKKQNHILL